MYVPYILAYKSPPKNRVHMLSKIIDPRISRRWLLRPCTGCKLCSAEAYTKIVLTGRNLQRRRDAWLTSRQATRRAVGEEGDGVGVTADA